MNKEKSSDNIINMQFEKVCRTCLGIKQDMQSLFGGMLPQMIMECTNVKIFETEGLPGQICRQCIRNISQCHTFKLQVESCDVNLREYAAKQLNKQHQQTEVLVLSLADNSETIVPDLNSENTNADHEKVADVQIKNEEQNKTNNNNQIMQLNESGNNISSELKEPPEIMQVQQNALKHKIISAEIIKTDSEDTLNIKDEIEIEQTTFIDRNTYGQIEDLTLIESSDENQESGEDVPISERIYKCDLCPKFFKFSKTCYDHMQLHKDDQHFECGICQRTFTRELRLKIHMRTHIRMKGKICLVCDKSFDNYEKYLKHKQGHLVVKPYECGICHKTYKWASTHSRHMETHAVYMVDSD